MILFEMKQDFEMLKYMNGGITYSELLEMPTSIRNVFKTFIIMDKDNIDKTNNQ